MGLQQDLSDDIAGIFNAKWQTRDGNVVPEAESLALGNEAVKLTATVLYADLSDSTDLVSNYPAWFAAEVYKSFLHCAAKIIRSEGGEVTAYDGDRVMAVFIHATKNTAAARTALKINHAVTKVLNPAITAKYPDKNYTLRQVVGVDTSELFVARTGIRGANDLVWVGRSANYAAKMCSFNEGFGSYITSSVFDSMLDDIKVWNGANIWEQRTWTERKMIVYRSNWTWAIS